MTENSFQVRALNSRVTMLSVLMAKTWFSCQGKSQLIIASHADIFWVLSRTPLGEKRDKAQRMSVWEAKVIRNFPSFQTMMDTPDIG